MQRFVNAALIAFLGLLIVSSPASAKRHSRHLSHHQQIQFAQPTFGTITEVDHVTAGRPSGCPHRFCGCEASLYKFGKIIPDLNLASNWIRKFPRAMAAVGMAAARSGHVMILMSHVSGSDWLVHDGNSGKGLTREHVRSISGYVIVDPNGNNVATSTSSRHQRTAQLPLNNY